MAIMKILSPSLSLKLFSLLLLFNMGLSFDPYNPYNLTDCRNETANYFDPGGKLRVLSWHIHFCVNDTDFPRFMNSFEENFASYFPPEGKYCPFGPDYILETFPFICGLGGGPPPSENTLQTSSYLNNDHFVGEYPWPFPQGAYFVPNLYIEEAWDYSMAIQNGTVDILKHPNTGCSHDDHSLRALWELGPSDEVPVINYLDFPCNKPACGCNDNDFVNSSSCGCDTPLASDSPEDCCDNCARNYDT